MAPPGRPGRQPGGCSSHRSSHATSPRGSGGGRTGSRTHATGPVRRRRGKRPTQRLHPPVDDAASVTCSSAAASCAAPARLCARPRSDLPRYREAHGCAVRTRDTARAPHTWRRWPWLALLAAASRSCARSATVERRRQLADHGMQPEPASLPRHAVHSQTHPPSTADHTAGPYPKQGKVSGVSGGLNLDDVPGQRGCERGVTATCGSYDAPCRGTKYRTGPSGCRRRNVTRRTAPAPDSHAPPPPRARPRARGPRSRPHAPARPCESAWPGWCGPATGRHAA